MSVRGGPCGAPHRAVRGRRRHPDALRGLRRTGDRNPVANLRAADDVGGSSNLRTADDAGGPPQLAVVRDGADHLLITDVPGVAGLPLFPASRRLGSHPLLVGARSVIRLSVTLDT
ncbi:hypothetical protein [Actinoplanes utahensis]|uniref:Uncharacterized protein n=1 Tax=Actinoplanes utahensis TaxID=1869 RepID=A0A0A6U9U5_ACTUT|nr:hypothetical protein MB27_41930 [Actinoplanes utahensis]